MAEQIWIIKAEFSDRDTAVTTMELLREYGVESTLAVRNLNDKPPTKPSETRLGALVLKEMQARKGRSVHYTDINAFCEERTYSGSSGASTLSQLAREGVIRALGRGLYQWKEPSE